MSMTVGLNDLEAALRERGEAAYVITVNDQGTPHVVLAEVTRSGGDLLAAVGPRTASFAERRPRVSLAYPVRNPSDYTLIVDAVATVARTSGGPRLQLAPTRAVLHRPAGPSTAPVSTCGSDCIPLPLGRSID